MQITKFLEEESVVGLKYPIHTSCTSPIDPNDKYIIENRPSRFGFSRKTSATLVLACV